LTKTNIFITTPNLEKSKRNKRIPICNPGAIIGCERLSEHPIRRDESHK